MKTVQNMFFRVGFKMRFDATYIPQWPAGFIASVDNRFVFSDWDSKHSM